MAVNEEVETDNAIKDMRKQGYGSLLYTMVESFIKDVYQSDKIGIALTKDTLSVRTQSALSIIKPYPLSSF